MKRYLSPQLIYMMLGTAFLTLGVLTLLNIAAALQVGGTFLWGAAVYAAMDFLIAYGLFERQWWVPHAFALNLAGIGAVFCLTVFVQGAEADPLYYAVALGLNALLAAFLYKHSARKTRKDRLSESAGVAFMVLWALMFCQTMINNFS